MELLHGESLAARLRTKNAPDAARAPAHRDAGVRRAGRGARGGRRAPRPQAVEHLHGRRPRRPGGPRAREAARLRHRPRRVGGDAHHEHGRPARDAGVHVARSRRRATARSTGGATCSRSVPCSTSAWWASRRRRDRRAGSFARGDTAAVRFDSGTQKSASLVPPAWRRDHREGDADEPRRPLPGRAIVRPRPAERARRDRARPSFSYEDAPLSLAAAIGASSARVRSPTRTRRAAQPPRPAPYPPQLAYAPGYPPPYPQPPYPLTATPAAARAAADSSRRRRRSRRPAAATQSRPLLGPLVGSLMWQAEAHAVVARARGEPDRRAAAGSSTGIPLVFDPRTRTRSTPSRAATTRARRSSPGPRGCSRRSTPSRRRSATDELFGTRTYDAYTQAVLPQLVSSQDGERDAAARTSSRSSTWPIRAACPARTRCSTRSWPSPSATSSRTTTWATRDARTGNRRASRRSARTCGGWRRRPSRGSTSANEAEADHWRLLRRAGDGRARAATGLRWTEEGGLWLFDFFARLDGAAGANPWCVGFLRTHPAPALRIPVVQADATCVALPAPGVSLSDRRGAALSDDDLVVAARAVALEVQRDEREAEALARLRRSRRGPRMRARARRARPRCAPSRRVAPAACQRTRTWRSPSDRSSASRPPICARRSRVTSVP